MNAIVTHRDLHAWREAMNLVEWWMRRCAVSVPSNIAEGSARNSTRELIQFLSISCGSLSELETQLELSMRLGYLAPDTDAIKQTNRVGRLVRALRNSLRESEMK